MGSHRCLSRASKLILSGMEAETNWFLPLYAPGDVVLQVPEVEWSEKGLQYVQNEELNPDSSPDVIPYNTH